MRVRQELILREIAGEHILVPVGETALRFQGMITLNESGLLLWQKLQSGCTGEDLVEALLAEYQVERSQAQADVAAFLEKLSQVELLEDV